jgi:hypothetical protein
MSETSDDFDSPAAVRGMRRRHADLGRRALAIASVALGEWEQKVARGEPLGMTREEVLNLIRVGREMIERSSDGPGDAPIPPPKKPN